MNRKHNEHGPGQAGRPVEVGDGQAAAGDSQDRPQDTMSMRPPSRRGAESSHSRPTPGTSASVRKVWLLHLMVLLSQITLPWKVAPSFVRMLNLLQDARSAG